MGAAVRVDDLTIAVEPRRQGRGLGRALMRHAEEQARTAGQRLMVVSTSSTDQYASTRRCYAALGYEEPARVRDHGAPGDDVVLFR